jgi:hypothetical protein
VVPDTLMNVQVAGCVPRDEHRDPAGVGREERARLRDLFGAAGVLPRAREDARALEA